MKGLPYSNGRGLAAAAPVVRKYTYPVKNLSIAVTSVTTAAGFGTAVIGDFPEGNVLLLGGVAYLQFSSSDADLTSATWNGDYSVGTTATADVTLSGTDINLINDGGGSAAAVAVGPAVAKTSPVTRGEGAAMDLFDNTDGSLELNLNLLVDAADIGDSATADVLVNGYVTLVYIVLGDD